MLRERGGDVKDDYKWRKKGDWWDLYIEEQAGVLEKLRQRGYRAEFAVGLDAALDIITEYLGEPEKQEVEF